MLALALALTCAAAPTDVKVSAPEVKKDRSTITVTFTDAGGAQTVTFDQFLVTTKDIYRSQKLNMSQVAKKGGKQWEAKDFVNQCEFDVTLELVVDSISVTDLDDDGKAEVSFLYLLGCRSDVSPLQLKLLLYEGAAKYAMRGTNRVKVGEDEKGKTIEEGGEFKTDAAFDKAPPKFLEHAKAQWAKFLRAPDAHP